MSERAEYTLLRQALYGLCSARALYFVNSEQFEVIMYNQVSRCFKTTGNDHSVCTILSAGKYSQESVAMHVFCKNKKWWINALLSSLQ